MSMTPSIVPNCLRIVSSDTAKIAATPETVRYSISGRGAGLCGGVLVKTSMRVNTQGGPGLSFMGAQRSDRYGVLMKISGCAPA
jgi:hypothetical protein